MNPFFRGFINGWNTVFGGVSQIFGDMLGFISAIAVGLFVIIVAVMLVISTIQILRDSIFPEIKEWWKRR